MIQMWDQEDLAYYQKTKDDYSAYLDLTLVLVDILLFGFYKCQQLYRQFLKFDCYDLFLL